MAENIKEAAYYAGRAKGYDDGTAEGVEYARAMAQISVSFSLLDIAATLTELLIIQQAEKEG